MFWRSLGSPLRLRIITRYVVFELFKTFAVILTVITMLLLFILLAQRAIQEGLEPLLVIRLTPYLIPDVLRLAIPATMLLATCVVYGKMSGANEIIAVKANGGSPMVVVWPAIVLAFAISLFAVWLNDIAVSWGRTGVDRIILRSVEDIVYGMLRTQRAYSNSRFSIHVKDVEDRKLIRPTISFHARDNAPPVTLIARQAELKFSPTDNQLKVVLLDTQFDIGSSMYGEWPDLFEYALPLSTFARNPSGQPMPSDTALRNISTRIAEKTTEIDEQRQLLATKAGYQLLTGNLPELYSENWKTNMVSIQAVHYSLNRYQTEPYRRWANGFSCLVFMIIGATTAIRKQISDFWTCFAVCFLPILVTYYPLFQFGVDKTKSGEFPPYCVWLGNIVFLIVGIYYLRRMMKN